MAAALVRTLAAAALRPLLQPRGLCAGLLGPLRAAGPAALPAPPPALGFKTKGVLRRRCRDCRLVKRRGRWFVYCESNPRHKQRQM
ncbi:large ribosomal subunit protein bL36m [Oryctolagus cuniculus]|uniref:Ribosomal protein n=1 Tax=Oryctolagus cuniculus TaxID=9986 RepID=G1TT95_RABIT|nr:39S ribosomal protein L36, mitochondrial [Oryctolagus cuniculus]